MFKNNKFLFALVLLAMAAVIAACGGGGGGSSSDGGGDSGSSGGSGSGGETTTQGDPDAGATVFENNCMTCHGSEGTGASAPSLQESDVAGDHAQVVDIVTNGRGNMPAFGDQLSEEEINNVAAYVNQLASN